MGRRIICLCTLDISIKKCKKKNTEANIKENHLTRAENGN